jgi:uncharacterized protein (TIGR00369 family)
MSSTVHFQKLEKMYLSAEINTRIFSGTEIKIEEGRSEISFKVTQDYHHALKGIHGAVYFKLLDDAAFFAVQSRIETHFILTSSFQINFLKSIRSGKITAIGHIKFESKNLFFGESKLYDEAGREVAFGTGSFVKSEVELSEKIGYKL